MEKVIAKAIIALGAAAVIAFIALIGGTVVYFLWPVAIPAAFPGLVESGALAARLPWWPSVALAWVFGTLVKASESFSKK